MNRKGRAVLAYVCANPLCSRGEVAAVLEGHGMEPRNADGVAYAILAGQTRKGYLSHDRRGRTWAPTTAGFAKNRPL